MIRFAAVAALVYLATGVSAYAYVEGDLVGNDDHATSNGTVRDKTYYVGLGLFTYDNGRISTNPSGAMSLFGPALVNLQAMARFPIGGGGWRIVPTFGFTPFGRSSPEGRETDRILNLSAWFAKDFGMLDAHLGLTLVDYIAGSGGGGTITENNGNGTAPFGLPPTASNAINYGIGTGLGLKIYSVIRGDLDFLILDTLTTRRTVDLLLSVSYGLL